MNDKLLDYLKNEIWFRAKPSSINGVGLFAIRDIPKGTNILKEFDGEGKTLFSIRKDEMLDIHPNVIKLWKDYWQNNSVYQEIYLPPNYKQVQVYYINHADNPSGQLVGTTLITNKDIKEGDEIFINYSETK